MKIFNKFNLFASIIAISSVFGRAVNNQITYYGCPDECSAQSDPSCGIPINTKYFAALALKFPNVNSHCGQYAIVMPVNGSKKLVKAKIVDTCEGCDPYHVDLSSTAFGSIVDLDDGIAEVIWAIYSSNGKKVSGPYCNNFDSAASKVGMSRSAFISSFEASAERLAKSGSNNGSFSSSGASSNPKTTKITTTKKIEVKKTTTIKPVVPKPKPIYVTPKPTNAAPKPTNAAPKQTSAASKPTNAAPKQVNIAQPPTTKTTPVTIPKQPVDASSPTNVINSGVKTIQNDLPSPTLSSQGSTPTIKPTNTVVNKINEEDNNNNNNNVGTTVGIITAIGGSCVGAAGVGILLMKKKSPHTYEDLKQKFPDSFNQVKKGISRGATVLKRKVTRKAPNTNSNTEIV